MMYEAKSLKDVESRIQQLINESELELEELTNPAARHGVELGLGTTRVIASVIAQFRKNLLDEVEQQRVVMAREVGDPGMGEIIAMVSSARGKAIGLLYALYGDWEEAEEADKRFDSASQGRQGIQPRRLNTG